ncbi:MAG: ASCH domain-containing protein [Bradyrhizobium sp.]|nr:ASCH domain-containing protein [Bradyrhizobium sp.]
MKALTIYQPWASLIMVGAKPFEFRRWDYSVRYAALVGKRIVVHASARPIKPVEIEDIFERMEDGESSLRDEIARPLLERLRDAYKCQGILELSAGLGTAIIGKPRSVTNMFRGTPAADSDRLDHSLYGWPLTDIQPFEHPRPCRGAQGFWNWPTDLEASS